MADLYEAELMLSTRNSFWYKVDCSIFITMSFRMSEHTIFCPICCKEFASSAQLKKHGERLRPCKPPVLQTPATEFRANSIKFNATLTKEVRQKSGIYFTPKKARDLLFQKLIEMAVAPTRILEPSFGTGEFLFDARTRWPAAELHGVEMNDAMFKSVMLDGAHLTCADFMTWSGSADLIIGNPPYFVLPAHSESAMTTGRPNIYINFLYKCLSEHLTPGGHLAFIIPTSIYNCSYYQPMRDYIAANTIIRHVETLDKPGFFETGQETTLLILQKSVPTGDKPFLFRPANGHVYISPHYAELYSLIEGSTTIRGLGLGVKTGNVVWNQVKENLTSDATKTLLIYASNIKGSVLVLDNLLGYDKKQYVKDIAKPTLNGPVILVERGYGNAFSFNSVLVNKYGFYAENHLNVVYPKASTEHNLSRVLASLKNPKTTRFVSLFNGNGTISASDLEMLIPIF